MGAHAMMRRLSWLLAGLVVLGGCQERSTPPVEPSPPPSYVALTPLPSGSVLYQLDLRASAIPSPQGAFYPAEWWPDGILRAWSRRSIAIPVPIRCTGALVLSVKFRYLTGHPSRCNVDFNGKRLFEQEPRTGDVAFKVDIPALEVGRGTAELRFEFPDAVSPKARGLGSSDRRILGAAFRELRVAPRASGGERDAMILTPSTPVRFQYLPASGDKLAIEPRSLPIEQPVLLSVKDRLTGERHQAVRLQRPPWRFDLSAMADAPVLIELGLEGLPCGGSPAIRLKSARVETRKPSPLLAVTAAGKAIENRSVTLISLDTVRPDALGAYGRLAAVTPYLDRQLRQSRWFPDAFSPSHWTLPSHASLFSGVDADVHGARRGHALPRNLPLLPQVLKSAGYATAGFVQRVGWLNPEYGFGRGFDLYECRFMPARMRVRRIRRFLRSKKHRPVFLFAHFYEAHSDFTSLPYEAPEPVAALVAPGWREFPRSTGSASEDLTKRNAAHHRYPVAEESLMHRMYAAGLSGLDVEMGRLLRTMRLFPLIEQGLTIFVSDHGEEFWEHGFYLHNQLYPETTRGLLALRAPGIAAGMERGLPTLIDVAPTVLDYAGLKTSDSQSKKAPEARAAPGIASPKHLEGQRPSARSAIPADGPGIWQGRSLLKGVPDTAFSYSCLDGSSVLRTPEVTLFCRGNRKPVLFLREKDPGEHFPLAAPLELLKKLQAIRRDHFLRAALLRPPEKVETSAKEEKRLQDLGYVK